jgi:MinD superfamily P-loop ATPase
MKIAIASGKGGTGKTTLSTNLASYLSENNKVVLCDLDVEEPNSALFLKTEIIHQEKKYKGIPEWHKNTCTLCGNCQEVCNYHAVIQLGDTIMVFPELCHSCYACSDLCPTNSLPMINNEMGTLTHFKTNTFDFVESRLKIGEEQAVPLIKQTLKYIDNNFSDEFHKIYDSPPGTSCPVIESTKNADFVILITEPTPFGFNDVKIAIETMKALNKNFGIVINRYGVGNDDVINYCKKNNIPVLAKIPNKKEIAELYSKGELLWNKIPEVKTELENIKNFIFSNIKN